MKLAVTGYDGNVGKELVKRGFTPLLCDITNPGSILSAIDVVKPDVIVHCAALTDVDRCEENPQEAFEINAKGTANLISAYSLSGINPQTIIYMSTDHVFSGRKWISYAEYHEPSPVNVYGLTKLSGEVLVNCRVGKTIIIRTSRLFNYEMMKDDLIALQNGTPKEFATFIKRSFLYLPHFVDALEYVINNLDKMPNILHIAGQSNHSYIQFWSMVADVFGLNKSLLTGRRERLKDIAPRPFNLMMNSELAKKLGVPLFSAHAGLLQMREDT